LTWLSGDIGAGSGLVFENGVGATMYLAGPGRFTTSLGTTFVNRGTLRHEDGATNQISLPFFNVNGGVIVNLGQLQFTGGCTLTNGLLGLNGTSVSTALPLMNYGGTIAGSGNIFGSVFNGGEIMPGWGNAIGQLAISGNCTQAVTATLDIELADTNQFDALAVAGQASVGGKLNIARLNDFTPVDGASFPILTCASRTGQFSEIVGGDLPNGRKLVPVYTANGVNLVVSNALPYLQLAIERLPNTNAVKLSWAEGYGNVILQTSTNLPGTNWTGIPVTDTNTVIMPITAPAQLFRLRQGP